MGIGSLFAFSVTQAEGVEARTIEVETSRGTKGTISIRASILPPNFQLADPSKYSRKGAKTNKRWGIMRDYNGLLVCREHRQIDCIPPRWTKFQTYDANVKVEINFDPELDEYFGITTAKQQIVIDDEMWEKLQHSGADGGGLIDLIQDLRGRRDQLEDELKAAAENRANTDEPRPSAVAMEQSAKFKGTVPEPTAEQVDEAQRNLENEVVARAEVTGLPEEQVRTAVTAETSQRRWEVVFAAIAEGPFYRPFRLGMQKRLVINTDHPFYTKVYNAAPEIRSALEVLLFVIAERELEVRGDSETFYRAERQRWSERLRHALESLLPDDAMADKAAAVAERMHVAMGEEVVTE